VTIIHRSAVHRTAVHRTAAGLAVGMLGTLFAAAVYTEAHRAPDQS
jgi:hypothetical protein